MWHAHLARVFTGGTPVPLSQTAPLSNHSISEQATHKPFQPGKEPFNGRDAGAGLGSVLKRERFDFARSEIVSEIA